MRKRVTVWKEVGETPLAALQRFVAAFPEYQSVPGTYAGRLDPMAEGKLLLLFGEECKRKERYLGLDKEYEVEVLLDVGSDTGDALGLVAWSGKETRVHPDVLAHTLREETGTHTRAYPPFSSKTVYGKPLFTYALAGTLSTIEIPTHEERVYAISSKKTERIHTEALRSRIGEFLKKVPTSDEPSKALGADFRIQDVREKWKALFREAENRSFAVMYITVTCASGTYMRTLAERIGRGLGTCAIALSIRRSRIGRRWFGMFFPI